MSVEDSDSASWASLSRVFFYIRKTVAIGLAVLGLVAFIVFCKESYAQANLDFLVSAYAAMCLSAIGVGVWFWDQTVRPLARAVIALPAGTLLFSVLLLLLSPNPFSELAILFTLPALSLHVLIAATGWWLLRRSGHVSQPVAGSPTRSTPTASNAQLSLSLPAPPQSKSPQRLWIKRGSVAAIGLLLIAAVVIGSAGDNGDAQNKQMLELALINEISAVASGSLGELSKAMSDLQGVSRDNPAVLARAMLGRCERVLEVVKIYTERQIRMLDKLQQHTDAEFADSLKVAIQGPGGDGRTVRISEALARHWKQTAIEVDKQMDAARNHCAELVKTVQKWR